eukprot:5720745-Prymnesium_polylepis.2
MADPLLEPPYHAEMACQPPPPCSLVVWYHYHSAHPPAACLAEPLSDEAEGRPHSSVRRVHPQPVDVNPSRCRALRMPPLGSYPLRERPPALLKLRIRRCAQPQPRLLHRIPSRRLVRPMQQRPRCVAHP